MLANYGCLPYRDRESERGVDFLSLPAEDAEALQSYLTPEQKTLLDRGLGFKPGLVAQSTEQLEAIVSYCVSCGRL